MILIKVLLAQLYHGIWRGVQPDDTKMVERPTGCGKTERYVHFISLTPIEGSENGSLSYGER